MSGVDGGYIGEPFRSLIDEFNDTEIILSERPLLAHYTSIDVLIKILENEEIWLSNPLFMNDLDEMSFCLQAGRQLFGSSPNVKEAARTPERFESLQNLFRFWYEGFEQNRSLNTYVFCLSRHAPSDNDGLLSMWRAYGNQGNGGALVFSTKVFDADKRSPLLIAKVQYGTVQQRFEAVANKLNQWCEILKRESIPDEGLDVATFALFSAFQILSLVTKHDGFREEREWRIIYMPELDSDDTLADGFHYVVGDRGVEPKLRLKLAPVSISPGTTWKLGEIIEKIIIGPTISFDLAQRSFLRVLDLMGKANLKGKVLPSSIPLRPT